MNPMQLLCPNCDAVILTTLGSFPFGRAHDGDKFEATCPHCTESFPIGYISEFKKITEEAEVTSSQPSAESSPGGGYEPGHSLTSSDDQRSNVNNPNNPAFKAAGENRSNQLNPNNPVFRSSRK